MGQLRNASSFDSSLLTSDMTHPLLVPVPAEDELLCDPSSGWLCSRVDCSLE